MLAQKKHTGSPKTLSHALTLLQEAATGRIQHSQKLMTPGLICNS
jgi:hypothetical protein